MVQVRLMRHSFKWKGLASKLPREQIIELKKKGRLVGTGLSVKGLRAAFKKGKQYGIETTGKSLGRDVTSVRTKFYSGTITDGSVRTRATAEMFKRGIKSVGGKVYEKVRARKGLSSEDQIADSKKSLEVIERVYGGDKNKALRAYLDGSTLEGSEVPKENVVKHLMRRLAVGVRYELMKQRAIDKMQKDGATKKQIRDFIENKQANMLNFSHSWGIDAVIEKLSGRKIESFKPEESIRVLEGLQFDISPTKVIMTYRGETFDITKKLKLEYPLVFRGVNN